MNRDERELRIIGGRLRGRKWRFPAAPGLRPTPDRVRETLFNWLQMRVPGTRCLDLFAGSGALGLEALSRGAAEVVFCEADEQVAADLRSTLERFDLKAPTRVEGATAQRCLQRVQGKFDIVFLDPPFDAGLLAPSLRALVERGLLAADALVYIEMPARDGAPALPEGWLPHRQGKAGEVGYHLVTAVSPAAPSETT
jgi:16S rRNA (guanine966-N2)-methyltransferase